MGNSKVIPGTTKNAACSGLSVRLCAAALAVLVTGALLAGCGGQSEEEKALQLDRERAVANFSEGVTPPPKPKPLPEGIVIEVPQSVKDRYSAVVMAVGVRKTEEVTKFTVKLGDTVDVPGTDYRIKIGEYLPTWVIKNGKVSTRGDEPVDPAVRATIFEGDETVFDGFIFEKHKTPSFITDVHVIGLVGVVER